MFMISDAGSVSSPVSGRPSVGLTVVVASRVRITFGRYATK